MQDITASDLPNADGFLRRAVLRVLAWVIAGMAYLHEGYLDWISLQSTPFTATGEYLEGWAAMAPTPVLREAPTFASGPATWPAEGDASLPAGTTCNRQDGVQYITMAAAPVVGGNVTATIVALVAGSNGNLDSGAPLTLATVVWGVNSAGATSGPITGGTDLELDPPLQARMLESYGAPPHGGSQADYVTWALEVPGVTRAWCSPTGMGYGTVVVYFMMDVAEAANGGFPQGTNGVAALESRASPATGDLLAVANFIYPLRPVTPVVYAIAPQAAVVNFLFLWQTPSGTISSAQLAQVGAALTALFLAMDSPLATTLLVQSQIDTAVSSIAQMPAFSLLLPNSFPVTSAVGYLLTLGTFS
jgi:uncharacterized phage protein gp47/JayE